MSANAGSYLVAKGLRDTLRSNIDMSNITAFSTRPLIIMEEEDYPDDTTGAEASGVLVIENEIEGDSPYVTYFYEHEIFTIDAYFSIAGSGHETSMNEYANEIKRVLRSLNSANNRAYEYRVRITPERYGADPSMRLEFTLVREYVKKYG